ncbi:MAG: lysophospholipid acyltransferase family protein [Verrucomicrobiota bacterium]|jgi:1-acyl-sn-glycerol-3-phosphate acyltransferase
MKGLCRHPFRVTGRFFWFAGEVILAVVDFLFHCAFRSKKSGLAKRALWLHRASRRTLRIFKLEPQVTGPIPSSGLLVSNHLSYLDILVFTSITPAVFVAKREIKYWPVIGWLATLAGTLFIDRKRRTDVRQLAEEIRTVLNQGTLVILFPEGTNSGGRDVLPFKSSLLEPAVRQTHPITVGCIGYALEDGDVSEEVCYWRDMTFFPHMLNLLSKRAVRAFVRFARFERSRTDRKELAQQLRLEVLKLKGGFVKENCEESKIPSGTLS